MLQIKTLDLPALAQDSDSWDDLWRRSDVRLPTSRAAAIQLWCDSFARDAELTAIIVVDGDRFVAGLPLLKDTTRWPLTLYRLPSNCTVRAGDYLLDPNCNVVAATQLIAEHLASRPRSLALFDGVEVDSDRWQRLIEALTASGRQSHWSDGFDVGVIDILHDWDAYTRSWSRNHRSAIKRSRKKLENNGQVTVERMRDPSDEQLQLAMQACYEIEDKSWKGENGTSILRTPGLAQYYLDEARLLRRYGALDLWLLKVDDRIIAFEYCHYSKATCFSHKISFDPQYQQFSPGRVLRCIQLEQYHDDPHAEQLDTLGVLCEAKAKWVTRTYRSSRCFVALGGPTSNLLLNGFKSVRRLVKRIRHSDSDSSPIKPGAQRYLETARPAEQAAAPPIVCTPPTSSPAAPVI